MRRLTVLLHTHPRPLERAQHQSSIDILPLPFPFLRLRAERSRVPAPSAPVRCATSAAYASRASDWTDTPYMHTRTMCTSHPTHNRNLPSVLSARIPWARMEAEAHPGGDCKRGETVI